jgi:hypothetical protein
MARPECQIVGHLRYDFDCFQAAVRFPRRPIVPGSITGFVFITVFALLLAVAQIVVAELRRRYRTCGLLIAISSLIQLSKRL